MRDFVPYALISCGVYREVLRRLGKDTKEIVDLFPLPAGRSAYFPPKSLLKKLPIDSKIPGARVTTEDVGSVTMPLQPQLTFSWPLSSFVTVLVHWPPCWQVPEHRLLASITQVSLHSQLEQTFFPALSVAAAVIVQVLPSAHVPVQEPPAGLQVQGWVTSPDPLQWHSA
jgi:hypothetical protein